MSNEQIKEGNRLIGEFMCPNWYKLKEDNFVDTKEIYTAVLMCSEDYEQLNYHKSWANLMEVVYRVELLGYNVMINRWTSVYVGSREKGKRTSITTVEGNDKLEVTYKTMINFVKYYKDENI